MESKELEDSGKILTSFHDNGLLPAEQEQLFSRQTMGSGIFPLRAFAVPGGQKSGASPCNKQRRSGEGHPRQEKKGPVVSHRSRSGP